MFKGVLLDWSKCFLVLWAGDSVFKGFACWTFPVRGNKVICQWTWQKTPSLLTWMHPFLSDCHYKTKDKLMKTESTIPRSISSRRPPVTPFTDERAFSGAGTGNYLSILGRKHVLDNLQVQDSFCPPLNSFCSGALSCLILTSPSPSSDSQASFLPVETDGFRSALEQTIFTKCLNVSGWLDIGDVTIRCELI